MQGSIGSIEASVIIPVRDAAITLAMQLEALDRQTTSDAYEVIVVDNGSRDQSVEVVQRYVKSRPDRFRSVQATAVASPGYARNEGLNVARGQFVLFCDADDIVEENWIEEMLLALRDADIVAGLLDEQAFDDRSIVRHFDPPTNGDWLFLPWGTGANLGLRRDLLRRTGVSFDEYPFGEDVDLCWQLQLQGARLIVGDRVIVRYRHRHDVRAVARQQLNYAHGAVRLYRRYRPQGHPRRAAHEFLRSWIWIVSRSPYLVLGHRRRLLWVSVTMANAGRLLWSLRFRVVFP
jgi:glycosyltransferase involved in cell wall biosynthesis